MFVHLYFVILSFSSIKDDIENCQRDTQVGREKTKPAFGKPSLLFFVCSAIMPSCHAAMFIE